MANVNVNPINGVPFGQEKTREDFLARAAWDYEQASKLRGAKKPIGYEALIEGHERTAKAYENAAKDKPSKKRASRSIAHSTTKTGDLEIGDAVQFRWEPGTGGVIRSIEPGDDARPWARVATSRGERKVPVDALWRLKSEHVARVRGATAHARVRKTKDIWVVQGNYGYGHGWEDVTAEETWKDAKRSIREYRENEPGIAFRVRKKREKIEEAPVAAHARKKKLDPREAKQRLMAAGVDFGRDFHELSSSTVDKILDVAKEAGYRKSKNAPGSTGRMYFQYLSRLK